MNIIMCKFYTYKTKNIMTKKEYLIKILENLESVRDLAPGLKLVVEQWALGDAELDVLIGAVESGIHSARSEVSKLKMKKGLDALENEKNWRT